MVEKILGCGPLGIQDTDFIAESDTVRKSIEEECYDTHKCS